MRLDSAPRLQTADLRVVLRPACSPADAESLRIWKNAHRSSYFDQRVIDPARQAAWFEALKGRDDDLMFLVVVDGVEAGCMGVRVRDGAAEVYNVNLGRDEYGGKGHMAAALQRLAAFAVATWELPVEVAVLKDNPAVGWYERNGFAVVRDDGRSWLLRWSAAASGVAGPAATAAEEGGA